MGTEWEYCELQQDKVIFYGDPEPINAYLVGDELKTAWYKLGRAGWELVGVGANNQGVWYVFKRPVQENRKINDAGL